MAADALRSAVCSARPPPSSPRGFATGSYWHRAATSAGALFDSQDLYRAIYRLYLAAPQQPLIHLGVHCFGLTSATRTQLDLFGVDERQRREVAAIDAINTRYGRFTLAPARMLGTKGNVLDRISFGSVKELEAFLFDVVDED